MCDIAAQHGDSLGVPGRELGSLEQAFHALNGRHHNHFVMAMEIDGAVSETLWSEALASIALRYPQLTAGIHRDAKGSVCFTSHHDRAIPVRRVVDANWQDEVATEVGHPFRIESEGAARITLVGPPERLTIIFAIYHAVADAITIVQVMRDLLRRLDGRTLGPVVNHRPVEDFVESELARARVGAAPPTSAPPPARFRHVDGSVPVVHSITFERDIIARLEISARQEHTTVHAVLAVATVEAIARLSGAAPASLRVSTPMNLRTIIPATADQAGLFIAPAIQTVVTRSALPWEAARNFSRELAREREIGAVAAGHVALTAAMAISPDETTTGFILATAVAHDVLLSNLGRLELDDQYGALRLNAVWGPAVLAGYEGEQMIGVATFHGELRLLHSSYQPVPELVEAIKQIVISEFLDGDDHN